MMQIITVGTKVRLKQKVDSEKTIYFTGIVQKIQGRVAVVRIPETIRKMTPPPETRQLVSIPIGSLASAVITDTQKKPRPTIRLC